MADEVLYERRGHVALITLNRPEYANAQNSAMTHALDAAFARAENDDEVAVLVLAGAGKRFCAGHDIGTPERDAEVSFDREATGGDGERPEQPDPYGHIPIVPHRGAAGTPREQRLPNVRGEPQERGQVGRVDRAVRALGEQARRPAGSRAGFVIPKPLGA
jgi:hypothetical protein